MARAAAIVRARRGFSYVCYMLMLINMLRCVLTSSP